jgi:hypothetical protein
MAENSIVNVCRSAGALRIAEPSAVLAEAIGFIDQAVRAATPGRRSDFDASLIPPRVTFSILPSARNFAGRSGVAASHCGAGDRPFRSGKPP